MFVRIISAPMVDLEREVNRVLQEITSVEKKKGKPMWNILSVQLAYLGNAPSVLLWFEEA